MLSSDCPRQQQENQIRAKSVCFLSISVKQEQLKPDNPHFYGKNQFPNLLGLIKSHLQIMVLNLVPLKEHRERPAAAENENYNLRGSSCWISFKRLLQWPSEGKWGWLFFSRFVVDA